MDPNPTSELHSTELCSRILAGDSAAEVDLVNYFLPRVRTMISVRTGDRDAIEDLGHEVMLSALCALRREMPRDPALLSAFIFGIARNVINGYFRRSARQRVEDRAAMENIPDATVRMREREAIENARREIEKLEPADRQVLELTLNEGMEPTEIAVKLGIPAATVRQRKSRALKRLQERLSRPAGPAPL